MCGCNKTSETFTVTLPDGSTKDVQGEMNAKIAVTAAGGGSYKKK